MKRKSLRICLLLSCLVWAGALLVLSSDTAHAQPALTTSITLPGAGTSSGNCAPGGPFLGDAFKGTFKVQNTGTAPGFQPVLEVYVPSGITLASATFADISIAVETVGTFSVGTPSLVNPYSLESVTGPTGSTFVVLKVPLGTIATDVGELSVELGFTQTGLVLGDSRTVGGAAVFAFGASATGSTPVRTAATNQTFTPVAYQVCKDHKGVSVTGPVDASAYTITVDIATGATLRNLRITDVVPASWQITGIVLSPGAAGTFTPSSTPVTPGGTVVATLGTLVGVAGIDATLTISGFYTDVLNEATCSEPEITGLNTAAVTQAEYVPPTGSAVALAAVNPNTGYALRPYLVHQSLVTCPSAGSIPSIIPSTVFCMKTELLISDYHGFSTGNLVTRLPDGLSYDGLSTVDGTTVTPTSAAVANGAVELTLNVPAQIPARHGPRRIAVITRMKVDERYDTNLPIEGGDSLDPRSFFTADTDGACTAHVTSDKDGGSDLTVTMPKATFVKSITAINGIPTTGTPNVAPGDVVTFRILATFPSGDDLSPKLVDFLPNPKFDARENGTTPVLGAVGTNTPIRLGALTDQVFRDQLTANSITVSTSAISASNSLTLQFASFETNVSRNVVLEVFLDYTATSAPMKNGLTLSNFLQGQAGSVGTTQKVVTLTIKEPLLVMKKGVAAVSADSAGLRTGTFDPTAAFPATGTAAAVEGDATNLDGKDTITFVIAIENQGDAPGYDLRIKDTPQNGWVPSNVRVQTSDFVTVAGTSGSLTGTGLLIPSIAAKSATAKTDVIFVLYDLVLDPAVDIASKTYTNTATLDRYGGLAGVVIADPTRNFLKAALSDTAFMTMRGYGVTKTLVSTTPSLVQIGDEVTYRYDLDIPEGQHTSITLTDVPTPQQTSLVYVGTNGTNTIPANVGITVPTPTTVSGGGWLYTFGTIDNTASTKAAEVVQIPIKSRVANVTAAQSAVVIGNRADLKQSTTLIGSGTAATLTIREPNLSPNATSVDTPGSNSAQRTISGTINHVGSSNTAYEPVYTITLPDGLSGFGSLTVAPTGGASCTNSVVGQVLTISCTSLTTSQTVPFSFISTVTATAPIASAMTAAQRLTWSSRPGVDANERDGSGGAGQLNDYVYTTALSITRNVTLAKALTVPATTKYAVGATFEYTITTTIPVGIVSSIAIADTIPTGLKYVRDVAGTFENPGLVLCNGILCALPTPTTTTTKPTWTFSTVTNPSAESSSEFMRWRILVQVANVIGNQKGTTVTNVLSGGGSGNVSSPAITVLEPIIVPTLTATATTVDGNDTPRFTLTLPNTGDSTAFETEFSIELAAARLSTPTNIVLSNGCTFVATPTVVSGNLVGTIVKVDNATTCSVAFDAIVDATVPVAATQALRAVIKYSSLSGVAADGERDGSGGTINDYTASVTLNLVVPNGTLVKTQDRTSSTATSGGVIALGETATFKIRVNLAEGTIINPQVSDTSSGMRVTGARLLENPAAMTGITVSFSPNPGPVGGPAIVSLGSSVINPADNVSTNDYVVLEVDAIGAFALAPLPATPHQNVATLSIGGVTQNTSTVALDLGTPQPLLAISATPSSVLVGGTSVIAGSVKNTGDSPACDTEVLVTVPSPFEVVLPVPAAVTYEAPNKVRFPIVGCLAPNAELTYTFSVRSTASAGGTAKDITAALQAYKSLPAGDGPVTIAPSSDGFDNDGVPTDSDDIAVAKLDSNAGPVGTIPPVYVVTGTTSVIIPIATVLTDPDGDSVANTGITIPVQPSAATVTAPGNGTIVFTPSPNTTARTVTFTINACDSDVGAKACADFPVTVTYNDPPTLTPVTEPTVLGQTRTYSAATVEATASQNVIAPGWDDSSLAVASTLAGTYGTASVATLQGGTCRITTGAVVYVAPTAAAKAGTSDTCFVRLCELLPGPSGVSATSRACNTTTYTFPLAATLAAVADSSATQKNTAKVLGIATLLTNDKGYDAATFALVSGTSTNGGTVTLGADNTVAYAPANNFTGSDTFSYRVCEPSYAPLPIDCVTAVVTIVVNAPPVVSPQTLWTVTGTASVTAGIVGAYSDPEGQALNPASVRVVAGPTAVLDPLHTAIASVNATTGAVTLTPTNNTLPERYTVEIEACDSFALAPACTRSTLTYNWNDTPVPPSATVAVYVSEVFRRGFVDIVSNTNVRLIDGGLDPSSIAIVSSTGICVVDAANQQVSYTAPATATTQTCTYRICESNPGPLGQAITGRACGTGVVTFNVSALLAANADAYATPAGTTINIPYTNAGGTGLLDNDSGERSGFAPTAANGTTSATSTNGGTVEFGTSPTGSVSYTPPAGFTGIDTFSYNVCDANLPVPACQNVVVSVNVNAPPVLAPNTTWIAVGTTAVTISIATLYSDGDRPTPDPILRSSIDVLSMSGGATTLDASDGAASGTIVVRPNAPNTLGTYVATVQACDDDQQSPRLPLCTTTTVTVRVNDPPVLAAQARTVLPTRSTTFGFETVYISNGQVTANGDADANGIEEALTAVGASLDPSDASFGNSTNLGPAAAGGSCTLAPATGDVIVAAPSVPGTYTCYVRVCEELPVGDPRVCSVAPVVITVPAGTHDARDDRYVGVTNPPNAPLTGNVLGNDTATDGGNPTVALVTAPATGTLVLGADGAFTFTPVAGYVGTQTFVYETTDSYGQTDRATVTLIVNDPPVGPDDRREIPQGGTYSLSLATIAATTLQGVVAPGIDLTSIGIISNGAAVDGPVPTPLGGTCALVAGAIVYTTPALSTGTDSCTIQVCEVEPGPLGRVATGSACDTFTLTFDLRDDFDTGSDDLATIAGESASVSIATLLANDDSEDAATFTLPSATSTHGGSVVRGQNDVSYSPAVGFCGDDSFVYRVCSRFDATLCVTETVAVDVDCIPAVAPRIVWVVIGTASVTTPTLPAFTDADVGDTLASVSASLTSSASATITIDGTSVILTPADPSLPTQYDVAIRACDSHTPRSACTDGTLTIIYNDPPTLPQLGSKIVRNEVRTVPLSSLAAVTSTNVINGGLDLSSIAILSGPCTFDLQADTATFTAPDALGPSSCTVRVCESNPGPLGLTTAGRACTTRTWTYTVVESFGTNLDVFATPVDTRIDLPLQGTGGLLTNDSGENAGTFVLDRTISARGGRVGYDPSLALVSYVPPFGFTGIDTFSYTVCDEVTGATCESAVVVINVNAPPQTEVATRFVSVGSASVTIDVGPYVRDLDLVPDPIDRNGIRVVATSGLPATVLDPTGGAAPGTLVVQPTTPASPGTISVTYSVCDADAQSPALPLCTTGVVVVIVNDPPTVQDEDRIVLPGRTTLVELDDLVTGTGLVHGDDPANGSGDGLLHGGVRVAAERLATSDPAWAATAAIGESGACTADAVTGDITVRAPSAPGVVRCFVRICEEAPANDPAVCSVAEIEILVPSGRTDAIDDAYIGVVGAPIVVAANGIIGNDGLISVATPSVVAATTPNPTTQGTLVLNSDGGLTFTPVANFAGVVTFDYTLADGFGQTDTATVTLTINDPPTVAAASKEIPEGATVTLPFDVFVALTTQGVVSTGLDPTSLAVVTGPCVIENGAVVYRSPLGVTTGTTTCDIKVCELLPAAQACGVGTYSFLHFDDFDPRPDAFATAQDTARTVTRTTLLANDDSELESSFTVATTTDAGGRVDYDAATGNIAYTPLGGFCGPDLFTYNVCDRFKPERCLSETVTVRVNCRPVLADLTTWVVVGTPNVAIDQLTGFSDRDGNGLDLASIVAGPVTNATVATTTSITTLTPNTPSNPARYPYTVTVCDDDPEVPSCTTANMEVIYNDPPSLPTLNRKIARESTYVLPIATILALVQTNVIDGGIDPTSIALDPDGAGTFAQTITTPLGGTCLVDVAAGELRYTAPAVNGTDTCYLQLCEANPGPLGTDVTNRACLITIGTFTVVDRFATNGDLYATPVNTGSPVVSLAITVADLLSNDFGEELTTFALTSGTSLRGGTVTVTDGIVTYTPAIGVTGLDVFTYNVCDEVALTTCETAQVAININAPPILGDRTVYVGVGTARIPFDIETLYGDGDSPTPDPLDGRSVRVTAVGPGVSATGATNGAPIGFVEVMPDDPRVAGSYTVDYEACDNDLQSPRLPLCDSGRLTIIVNDPPVVANKSVTLLPGTGTSYPFASLFVSTGAVKGDDPTDGDSDGVEPFGMTVTTTLGDPFAVSDDLGSNGTCSVVADAIVVAGPTDRGTFTCWVQICEELPANPKVCSVASITILVPTGATVANDDSFIGRQTDVINGAVLGNDTVYATGSPSVALSGNAPNAATEGTLVLRPDGTFMFTPVAAFVGVTHFDYTLSDGLGGSDIGTVTLIVNDAPVLASATRIIDPGAQTTLSINTLITNYGGYDGGLGLVTTAGPCTISNGIITLQGDATPGDYTCLVTVCEAVPTSLPGACATIGVTIVVPSGGLNALPDSYATRIDTALTVAVAGVLGNDSVNSSGTKAASLVTGPAHGTLTLNGDGSFTYTPESTFVGVDSYQYELTDGLGHEGTTTVTIIVNDPPVLASQRVIADPETTPSVALATLITSYGGYDGGLGTVTVSGPCARSGDTIVLSASATPGTTTCNITICEAIPTSPAPCATTTISLVVPSGTLVANDDSYATAPGVTLTVPVGAGIAFNDSVNSEGTKTVTLEQLTTPDPTFEGILTLNPNGSFTFAPVAGYAGILQFVYDLRDGLGHSDNAIVTITINDPPVLKPARVVLDPNTSATVPRGDYLVGFGVVDGGLGVVSVTAGACTIASNQVVANGGATPGSTTCTIQVCEATPANVATCASTTITVVVPSGSLNAVDDNFGVLEGGSLSATVATNDTVDSEGIKSFVLVDASLPDGATEGTVAMQTNGSFVFTPAPGFTGVLTFDYTLSDGRGHNGTATVTLTVNDPPVLTTARVVIDLGSTSTVTVASLITSFGAYDGGLGNVSVSGPCSHAAGVITLQGNTAGTTTCDVTVCELAPASPAVCASTTVSIVVPTGALTAVADAYATRADEALTIAVATGVLGNDSVNSEGVKTATVVAGTLTTTEGTVVLASNGSFVFTPATGFTGLATFDYTLSDGLGHSGIATVTITVNDPPELTPTRVVADRGTTTTVALTTLVTSYGGYDGGLGAVSATGPCTFAAGTITLTAGNTAGTFTCTVQVCEAIPADPAPCASTTITLVVPAGALLAVDDSYSTTQGSALTVPAASGVAANDTVDSEGTKVVVLIAAGAPNPTSEGTLVLAADGGFTFTPVAGFAGLVTFDYTLSDGRGHSDTGTATITVNDPPNLTPVRVVVPAATTTNVDRGDYLADLGVVDGGLGVVSITSGTSCSVLANQLVINAPVTAGTTTCQLQVCELSPATACSTTTITVVVASGVLAANDDAFATAQGTPITATVADNDSVDSEGTASFSLVTATLPDGATEGSVTLRQDGTFTFTPVAGFAGELTFDYTLDDGNGNSAIATVTIVVNDPPVLSPVAITVDVGSITTVPTGDVVVSTGTYDGTLVAGAGVSPLGADGTCTVLPNRSVHVAAPSTGGVFTCEVEICEAVAEVCTTTTLTVTVPSGTTTAGNDAYTTLVATPVSGNLASNDTVPDLGTVAITLVAGTGPTAAQGTLTINDDGTFTFTPTPGFTGVLTFEYTLSDGLGHSDTGSVTIVVNDPPILAPTTVDLDPNQTSPIPIADLITSLGNYKGDDPNDGDSDGIGLVSVVAGNCTVSGTNILATAPQAAGETTCTIMICEEVPANACASTLITIVVPYPLVATDDLYYVAADTTLTMNLAMGLKGNDTITAPGTSTVTLLGAGPNPSTEGTLTLSADGSFMFVPVAGFAGTVTFDYTLRDAAGNTTTATVTIIVNDGPELEPPVVTTTGGETIVIPLDDIVIGTGEVTADVPGDGDTDGIDQPAVGVSSNENGPFSDTIALGDDGSCSAEANGDITIVAPSDPGTYTCWLQVCEELPATAPRACSVTPTTITVQTTTSDDPDGDAICTGTPVLGTCDTGNDNCADVANPDQNDLDEDGLGDACDDDDDGDGLDTDIEVIGETNPLDPDSDDDGLCDGPADPAATVPCDGAEDDNANGVVDPGESNPNDPNDPVDNRPPDDVAVVLSGDGGCSGATPALPTVLVLAFAALALGTRRRRYDGSN